MLSPRLSQRPRIHPFHFQQFHRFLQSRRRRTSMSGILRISAGRSLRLTGPGTSHGILRRSFTTSDFDIAPNPFTEQGNDPSILRILVLGAPGSGKGTYSGIISKHFDLPHISSGDLCRAEIVEGTPLGQKIAPIVEAGELLDNSDITPLVFDRLAQPDTLDGHKFILDGFPRTIEQAGFFVHEWLLDAGYPQTKIRTPFHLVINLHLPEDILVAKITGRRQCVGCGRSFNLAHIKIPEKGINLPPLLPKKEGICDDCDGELVQRPDDVEETVRERIALYNEITAPVADFYKNQQEVDGRRFLDLDVAAGRDAGEKELVAYMQELQRAIESGEEQERWYRATLPEAIDSWV